MSATSAVHDGRAGNARQALALARALDGGADEIVLRPGLFARWFAPRTWPLLSAPFGPGFRADCETPPALAIGCGRQAALATRLLRRHGSRAVQLLDPRIATRHWDIVVAPRHDALQGDNVISVLGSLNPVDDLWLAQARHANPAMAQCPAPHTLLLVGGPTRHAALSDDGFQALVEALARRAREERGSFSATASRRTPRHWREMLARVPADVPGLRWRDARDGENPYAGLLGHAQRIVCTPDSVNMLSEAAATLAPVHVWASGMARGRLKRFLDALSDSGRIRPFDHALSPYAVEPLRETARVAAEVRHRLDQGGR